MYKILLSLVFVLMTGKSFSQIKYTAIRVISNMEEAQKDDTLMNILNQAGFDITDYKVLPVKKLIDSTERMKKEGLYFTIYTKQIYYTNNFFTEEKFSMKMTNVLGKKRTGDKLLACYRSLKPDDKQQYVIDLYWIE